MQSFRKYPFARLLIYLVIGLLLGYYCPQISCWGLWCAGAVGMVFYLLLRFFRRYAYVWLFGCCISLLIAGLGFCQVNRQANELTDSFLDWEENVAMKIIDVPLEKEKTVKISVRVLSNELHENVRLIFYVKKDAESLSLREGDWIEVDKRVLLKKRNSSLSGFAEFDYEAYLRGRGFSGSFYLPEYYWRFLSAADGNSILKLSHQAQKRLVGIFADCGIEGDELGVLAALSIGDKMLLDRELRNSYALTGASHILAVSGLHVGVVFFVFVKILSLLLRGERYEKLRVSLSLLLLWMFTFVTGLSPSVIRASIMLSISSVAVLLNRRSQTYNAVFISAFFMLLYSPRYLFDIGFQLSYLAVFSILMFQKPIYEALVARHVVAEKIWALLSVSLAAQLGTLPLTIYYFHQSSNLFWLSGFVVIPLSSVIIYLSILLWVSHWIPVWGDCVASVLGGLVKFMNGSIRWMEELPGVVANNLFIGWVDLCAFYIILLALYFFAKKNTFRRFSFLLSVVLLYTLFHTLQKLLS